MLGRERRESRERCGRAKPQHGPRGAPSTRTVPGRVKEATGEDRQDWHGGTSSNGAVGGGKRQSRSARKRVDRARLLIGAQAWFTHSASTERFSCADIEPLNAPRSPGLRDSASLLAQGPPRSTVIHVAAACDHRLAPRRHIPLHLTPGCDLSLACHSSVTKTPMHCMGVL